MKRKPLYTAFDPTRGWWVVTFHNGVQRNYGSLETYLGFLRDYYK